ncbi:hypothetical protein AB0P12_29570 [Streptomyces subrutilus]|uniref:hypothetical protein n=1 Tax=Streptomyces subrutilus TaxID=36818 RepID=UPI0033DBC87F
MTIKDTAPATDAGADTPPWTRGAPAPRSAAAASPGLNAPAHPADGEAPPEEDLFLSGWFAPA